MSKQIYQPQQEYSVPQQIPSNVRNTTQKTKLNYSKHFSYAFPIKLLKYTDIKGKNHFKQLLKFQAQDTGYDKCWKIMINNRKDKNGSQKCYINVKCGKCKALLLYRENEQKIWVLQGYRNSHIHDVQDRNAYQSLISQAIMRNLNLSNEDLYRKINQSYKITKTDLLRRKKVLLKELNFKKVETLLRSLNYQYKITRNTHDLNQEGYPDTLVATSDHQKTNYINFGECVCYDITYNYIKQTSFEAKDFVVGIFSGFDNNNRMLIFGISISVGDNTKHYQNIFKSFFDLVGSDDKTTSIITHQQKNIMIALNNLLEEGIYQYHHVFNNREFLESFKYSLTTIEPQIKNNLYQMIKKMMIESDPNVGQEYLEQIKMKLIKHNLAQQCRYLQNKLRNICLWKMPNQFIGLSLYPKQTLTSLMNNTEKFNKISIYELIEKTDKISKKLMKHSLDKKQFEYYAFENIFDDTRIKQLRDKFQKVVINSFIFNYNRSQLYHTMSKNIQHIIDKDCYFIQNWKCSCAASQKTGIPCQHIIYISKNQIHLKSYIDLIDARWKPLESKLNRKLNISQTRGRKTRRNQIR